VGFKFEDALEKKLHYKLEISIHRTSF